MPFGKSPGPSVKNPQQYEALKGKGMSKTQAAKISNAAIHRRLQKGKKGKHKPQSKHLPPWLQKGGK